MNISMKHQADIGPGTNHQSSGQMTKQCYYCITSQCKRKNANGSLLLFLSGQTPQYHYPNGQNEGLAHKPEQTKVLTAKTAQHLSKHQRMNHSPLHIEGCSKIS